MNNLYGNTEISVTGQYRLTEICKSTRLYLFIYFWCSCSIFVGPYIIFCFLSAYFDLSLSWNTFYGTAGCWINYFTAYLLYWIYKYCLIQCKVLPVCSTGIPFFPEDNVLFLQCASSGVPQSPVRLPCTHYQSRNHTELRCD